MHRVKESRDTHVTEVICRYLEDLEAGNVEDSYEGGLGAQRSVERFVDSHDNPLEESLIECLGQSLAGELSLGEREMRERGREEGGRGEARERGREARERERGRKEDKRLCVNILLTNHMVTGSIGRQHRKHLHTVA